MEKNLILVALAVFSIFILLSANNIDKVFALTVLTVTHGAVGAVTIYPMPSISGYIIRPTGGTSYKFVSVAGAVSSISLPTPFGSNLYGSEFDCSGTICQVYEVCVPCGAPEAYIVTFTALTGVVTANTTIPLTGGTGTEFSALSATGSSSMYFGATCASGNTILIKSDLTRLGECAGTMNFAISTVRDVKVNGPYTAVSTSSGGTTAFSIWNGGSRVCAVALINAGDIAVTATGWLLRHGNTVSRLNNSCTVAGTLSHGLTTLTGLNINVGRGEIYVRGDSFVQVMNTTDFTKLYRLDLLDGTAPPILFHNMATNVNNAQLAVVYDDSGTGAKKVSIYRLSDATTGGGTTTPPTSNSNNGRCGNGTVLDCVTSQNPFIGVTGGQNVTLIAGTLTNGLGITHCNLANENDVDTCGSGLFLFLFLLLLSEFLALAGYLGFVRITHGESQLMDIGLIVLIIAFTDIAIAFYLNWIPDIVFYTIVVLVAGLLTMGLLSRLRG